MISEKDVEHIAVLSRIELDDATRERMKNELSGILDYIEMLSSVPTENVTPLYQVTGLNNRTRPDEHRNDFSMDESLDQRLVGQAPQRKDRYVQVKGVLKK